jgi:procollagen-lysine,2-oxoglutarate 5-dioxygenase
MNVLMWATRRTAEMDRVVESFRRIGGVEPVIVGMGEQHSWQARIIGLHRWCAEHPSESVLCVDAYDTCCVQRVPDMTIAGLVFSAEANCWPDKSLASEYPQCGTRYRYLNAGVWLGNTDAYCEMIERCGLLSGVDDDQRSYTRAYLDSRSHLGGIGISLNHSQGLCHNRYGAEDDWEIADGIYWVRSTGEAPLVAHGNGGSDIKSVWEAFGV